MRVFAAGKDSGDVTALRAGSNGVLDQLHIRWYWADADLGEAGRCKHDVVFVCGKYNDGD